MDEVLKQVILGAPNVAIAILALVWASKVIDRQIDATGKLVDKLIDVLAENDRLKEQIAAKDNSFDSRG
jgi:hypothetical protein